MTSLRDLVEIVITADGTKARSEFEKVGVSAKKNLGAAEKSGKSFGTSLQKVGLAGGVAAIGLGAGLFHLAEMASEAEVQHAKLENTVSRMPQLAHASIAAFDAQAMSLEHVTEASHHDVEGIQALLGQFGLTQSQIIRLTPLVVDLSRKMGIDTATAAKAVGKAVDGSSGALKRMGIVLNLTKDPAKNLDLVMSGLSQRVGGFATREGKTMGGRLVELHHEFQTMEEEIGAGVLPVMAHLTDAVGGVVHGFAQLPAPVKATAGTVGALAVGGLAVVSAFNLVVGTGIKFVANLRAIKPAADAAAASTDALAASEEAAGAAAVGSGGLAAIGAVAGPIALLGGAFLALSLDVEKASLSLHGIADEMNKTGDSASKAAAGPLTELLAKHKFLTDDAHKAGISQQELADAILHGGAAYTAVQAKIKAYLDANVANADAQRHAIPETREFSKWIEDQRRVVIGAAASHRDYVEATRAVTGAQKKAADSAKDFATADIGLTQALHAHGEAAHLTVTASDALLAAQNKLEASEAGLSNAVYIGTQRFLAQRDAQRQGATSVLDYDDAVAGATDKQKAYNDAVKAHGKASAEAQQAERDLKRALLETQAAGDGAVKTLIDNAKATAGGRDDTQQFVRALEAEAKQYPELAGAIDNYIARLNLIPPYKNTQILVNGQKLNFDAGGGNLNLGGGHSVGGRARGGQMSPGELALVGDPGPNAELVQAGPGGARVFTASQTRSMMAGGRGGVGVGGMTIVFAPQVHLHALDAATAGQQAGRAVLDALSAVVLRGGGKGQLQRLLT